MRKVPKLVQNYNDKKGKPLFYVMLPVSCLVSEEPPLPAEILRSIEDIWGLKIVHLFDHINELRQKAYDMFDEMNNHSHCVTNKQMKGMRSLKNDLEVQAASAKCELARLVKNIRSSKENAEQVDFFCDKHNTTAEDNFRKCDEIYETAQAQIKFHNRCERWGAKYLAPPVEQSIASADYDNVYVLFHGETHNEATKKNELAFIELAKKNQKRQESCLLHYVVKGKRKHCY